MNAGKGPGGSEVDGALQVNECSLTGTRLVGLNRSGKMCGISTLPWTVFFHERGEKGN